MEKAAAENSGDQWDLRFTVEHMERIKGNA